MGGSGQKYLHTCTHNHLISKLPQAHPNVLVLFYLNTFNLGLKQWFLCFKVTLILKCRKIFPKEKYKIFYQNINASTNTTSNIPKI